jgi:hypothetical protein
VNAAIDKKQAQAAAECAKALAGVTKSSKAVSCSAPRHLPSYLLLMLPGRYSLELPLLSLLSAAPRRPLH